MGFCGLTAGPGRWVGPTGSARKERDRFIFFISEFIFNAKTIPEKSRNCFRGTKITQKIPEIPGKFPETHWDMNNPNKVFGAHEKDFRAF
jgi:hypothetical protein